MKNYPKSEIEWFLRALWISIRPHSWHLLNWKTSPVRANILQDIDHKNKKKEGYYEKPFNFEEEGLDF